MSSAPEARRLTGPHLLGDWTGAALDVTLSHGDDPRLAEWERQARRLMAAVGWPGTQVAHRRFAGGANLAISAPADVLYSATDLTEEAWRAAEQVAAGQPPDADAAERLRESIARERSPRLLALAEAAALRGLTFLHDDDGVSVGSGSGSRLYSGSALPDPADVEWDTVHDVPVALVTGSNGKTTTTRLIAAMAAASGHSVGLASTDGVVVGSEVVVPSDYAGPMGARMVLRDTRVTLAVLETARGGILRRGLAVRRAGAAIVTNVAEDHFGDFGVESLDDLADAKLVIARVVPDTGPVVLNADDPTLVARGSALGRPVTWFSLDTQCELLRRSVSVGGTACFLEDETIVFAAGSVREPIVAVADVPMAAGGAARYNIANALAATAAARLLRTQDGPGAAIRPDAVASALRAFRSSAQDNAGRGNLLEVGGVRVLIDYAHNPHGFAAITQLVDVLPSERRLIVLGQAGDRSDDAIRGLARAAWELRPDRILLKDLAGYRRGRAPGEVQDLLAAELERIGVPGDRVERVDSEVDAARSALAWARPGDLLLLLTHEDQSGVARFVDSVLARGWRAGDPVD